MEDYPITSNVGYYPGCVDYLDQEMVFSHVNDGEMNLGETTTAAFTLFEEMGQDVSYQVVTSEVCDTTKSGKV